MSSPLSTPAPVWGLLRVDTPPPLRAFGDVLAPPRDGYRRGEKASAAFAGTNPNADLRRGDTYLSVERRDASGRWVRIHDDSDWSTFIWFEQIVTVTTARIDWLIPADATPGSHRIVYSASGRGWDGQLFPVRGASPAFEVR